MQKDKRQWSTVNPWGNRIDVPGLDFASRLQEGCTRDKFGARERCLTCLYAIALPLEGFLFLLE